MPPNQMHHLIELRTWKRVDGVQLNIIKLTLYPSPGNISDSSPEVAHCVCPQRA